MKSVVIVGGGFAGLSCARELARSNHLHITLIDKNNYQQFQPLLYQVATAALAPSNVAFNLRNLFRRHSNVDIKMAEVVSVDLNTRTAVTVGGQKYQGDFLVLAAGSEANFFGTPGADKCTYPLYSLRDAEVLRSRIIAILHSSTRARSISSSWEPVPRESKWPVLLETQLKYWRKRRDSKIWLPIRRKSSSWTIANPF
jgi:NADH dehydrogenase